MLIDHTSRLTMGALFLLALIGCAPAFTRSDPEDLADFITVHATQVSDHAFSYVEAGTPGRPLLVFIHGTPGSWQGFEHLLRDEQLQACCHMIAVDRLGFGASAGSGVQPNFLLQSTAIASVFKHNRSHLRVIVAGHSLGGSIATKVATLYPQKVGGLLIISSALDPDLSHPRWYHRLADLPLIRSIIPANLHLANEEMLPLQESLSELSVAIPELTIPVRIIQGGKDPLVDHRNPDFAEALLSQEQVVVERLAEDGHFIIWEKPDMIVEHLLALVAGLTAGEP